MKYIEQNKFSENIIAFRYVTELNRDTITAMNVLCYMLKSKCEKYPNKEAISLAFNRNYGMKLSVGLTSYGKQLVLQYRFHMIRQDWIEQKEYTQNVIDIMDQFLNHVVLDEKSMMEAKYLLKNRLITQRDDPANLSIITAFEGVDGNHSISIPVGGILEKVDEITFKDIEELYTSLKENKPHVYACGCIDECLKEFLESVDNECSIESDYELIHVDHYSEKIIEKDIEQTNITRVYQTSIDTKSEDYFALLLMNSIFGQSQMNLLFQEIREKHSLCYYISSNVIRFDGALYVLVGCQKENIDEILALIDEQLDRLIRMDYSDFYLECAKKDWLDGMVAGKDNQYSYIERAYIRDMLHTSTTLEERIEKMNAVTKEDVARCAKQLKCISMAIVKEADNV